MNTKNDVVLVTTTFSKTIEDNRAQLALKTCRAAGDCGYRIIVVDGSPCKEFKSELCETGATVIDQQRPGMGQSRRECILAGLWTNAQVIVWLEPEKYPIVPLLDSCALLVLNGEADLVIPRRWNLDGYPDYQHFSELRANWELGSITNRPDLDFYIGPRVMNRSAATLMSSYDGKVDGVPVYGDNWEILFIPLITMIHRNYNISSVTVDYVHPPEQKIEDDEAMRAKRDKQRVDLVGAMKKEWNRIFVPDFL